MADECYKDTVGSPGQPQKQGKKRKGPLDICTRLTRVNKTPGPSYGQTYEVHLTSVGCAYCNSDWFESPTEAPLFYWPISGAPISEKLARMREALENGADPNEVDHSRNVRRQHGRPLNMCLMASEARGNFMAFFENAPVIELLLQYGADPRLEGEPDNPNAIRACYQPIVEAKASMEESRDSAFSGPEEVEFYKRAYQLMKDAADRLDERDLRKQSWTTRLSVVARRILGNTFQ